MFTTAARKYSRVFLEPMARFISWTGVSPNVITILGSVLMIGVAFILAWGYFFWGGLLIMVVAIFDALDGMLARMMGQTTRFGAFLDSTLDRFSEAIIFLGLFIYLMGQNQPTQLLLIYATVVGSLMVSYTRARAEGLGVALKEGFFTRFERLFLLVVGLLLNQLTFVLWLLAIFSLFTAFQRMYLVWRIIDSEKGG